MNDPENTSPEPSGTRCLDDYVLRWLERSPVVVSKSGREYKLWALKALVLALRTARIERDKCGVITKRWSPYHASPKKKWR